MDDDERGDAPKTKLELELEDLRHELSVLKAELDELDEEYHQIIISTAEENDEPDLRRKKKEAHRIKRKFEQKEVEREQKTIEATIVRTVQKHLEASSNEALSELSQGEFTTFCRDVAMNALRTDEFEVDRITDINKVFQIIEEMFERLAPADLSVPELPPFSDEPSMGEDLDAELLAGDFSIDTIDLDSEEFDPDPEIGSDGFDDS